MPFLKTFYNFLQYCLKHVLNRGSNMNAYILLKSLNKMGKTIKCETC